MAGRFAAQAREAIAAAVQAGATPRSWRGSWTTPAATRRSTGRTSTARSPGCARQPRQPPTPRAKTSPGRNNLPAGTTTTTPRRPRRGSTGPRRTTNGPDDHR
jgi:hypothetical protein